MDIIYFRTFVTPILALICGYGSYEFFKLITNKYDKGKMKAVFLSFLLASVLLPEFITIRSTASSSNDLNVDMYKNKDGAFYMKYNVDGEIMHFGLQKTRKNNE